eukprot:TRINITY_DN121_c0_g2_i3.p2 TRINITY_DN121_c0_g2~~TRINITY_DN121_c0_g2_i3.p2  ORF type:complete len:154 (+),score=9.01 TRINITY_DN121_c0_g2_i3:501-962(+)
MDIFGTIKEHHPIYISNLFNSNYIQQKLNLPSSQFKFHFQLQKSLNIYIKLFSKEMIWNSSQSINISQSHHIDIHFTHKIFGQNKKISLLFIKFVHPLLIQKKNQNQQNYSWNFLLNIIQFIAAMQTSKLENHLLKSIFGQLPLSEIQNFPLL